MCCKQLAILQVDILDDTRVILNRRGQSSHKLLTTEIDALELQLGQEWKVVYHMSEHGIHHLTVSCDSLEVDVLYLRGVFLLTLGNLAVYQETELFN